MSDSAQGAITWLIIMAYAVALAFITHASPLLGAILGTATIIVTFWIVAVKGKAAA